MKTKSFLITLATLIFMVMGCNDKEWFSDNEPGPPVKSSDAKLKIAVVSDIHYMDHTLLPAVPENNADFQALLLSSYNKLVEMSEPIFMKAVSELKAEKPDVLLITGDLANNGELINHEIVKGKLQELAESGIKVLVIPGNNDINSPDARSYAGTGSIPVTNLAPDGFASLYGDFGYNDALYRDANSLSYIFKLRDNLWVLAIDACIYVPANKRSGAINPNTMIWIQEKMTEARENNITVLAMMHHGLTEHYTGQNAIMRGDVVNNFNAVSTSLMNAGIKLVFTGHSHANDIVELTGDGKSIFDIETGSLITPLNPYRIMTLDDNFIKIETRRITEIDQPLPGGEDFLTYSNSYLAKHLDLFFTNYLVAYKHLPLDLAETTVPYLRNSMIAQYAGDEKIMPDETRNLEELDELLPPDYDDVIATINNFWADLSPNDNKIHIKLK